MAVSLSQTKVKSQSINATPPTAKIPSSPPWTRFLLDAPVKVGAGGAVYVAFALELAGIRGTPVAV